MPDITTLITPRRVASPSAQQLPARGLVAVPPASLTDDILTVTLPSYSADYGWPCRWVRQGNALPAAGTECLVLWDETGAGTVVQWAGAGVFAVHHASSGFTQTGSFAADMTYTQCELTLPAGTWRIEGWASMYSSDGVSDYRALALWNATTSTLIPNSTSGTGISGAMTTALPFYASTVATIAAATIRLRQIRNGASTPAFVGGVAVSPNQRLMAARLA